ncbi:MAG: TIGR03960 family B12-binding radical SAM protein [Oligoflexia bacterium]|nr:TIGR03960 family B12-binding radical SAM protein [Oligoflexia bacterium]
MSLPVLNDNELLAVQKPAQYLGGERGAILKDDSAIELHVCLAFPDTYEVGMSHIGFQILYDLINRDQRMWAERAYTPLPDMEALLKRQASKLFSLESRRALCDFDVVGMSLQYELCLSGILNILDLGGIPLLQRDRTESDPLIIGGGPVCYHPEPFADFFDCFLIGDGEELVPEFLNKVLELRKRGAGRAEQLLQLAKIQGVYVPALFEPQYEFRGSETHAQFQGFKPLLPEYTQIRRRIIPTLEGAPYPTNPVVPTIKAIHDRLSVEVMRGCVRGCRFCQAGYLYRPQRERSPEEIIEIVGSSLKNSGYEELSLLSLSTADYCSILPLLSTLKERFAPQNDLAISFPSTRVDALKPELLQEVQPIRRSGFTIAPEAGTQRLRDLINKGVTDEQLMETCRNVFKLGWHSIKMYFMIGLPTETDEDLMGIVDLARRVKAIAGRGKDITVSVSSLVPKPHTPFQWAAQISATEILRRQDLLRRELRKLQVNFRYHDSGSTFLEGVFARGDRQLGRVILRAYQLGARLDGWAEHLKLEIWMKAFEECGIDPHHYLHERDTSAALPWDHISCDIPKRYFLKEWQRAVQARVTPDCLTQSCSVCGACDYDATRNVLFDRARSEKRLGITNPAWQKILELRSAGHTSGLLELAGASMGESASAQPRRERSGKYALKEYLKTEVDGSAGPRTRGLSTAVQTIRFRYQKKGPVRFISHLELAGAFFRAARRAGIAVAFSQGFNPRPRMSFGPPLQLGVESECEFVDINLSAHTDPSSVLELFNRELPSGLRMLAVHEITPKERPIQAALVSQSFRASRSDRQPLAWEITGWEQRIVSRVRADSKLGFRLGDCVEKVKLEGTSASFVLAAHSGGPTLKPSEVTAVLSGENADRYQIVKYDVQWE